MESRLINRFSFVARGAAITVVIAVNPIHSVLGLVLAFVNVCGLMLRLQVEFIALIFRVVYVGAIAVLFLFVIMMLNLGTNVKNNNRREQSIVGGLGLLFLVERYMLLNREMPSNVVSAIDDQPYVSLVDRMDGINTMETLGQVLYTHYFIYVVIAGFVLLIAMIGAIVLTLQVRTFARAKRQLLLQQRSRNPDNAVMMVRVKKE